MKSLADIVSDGTWRARLTDIAECVARASEPVEIQALLHMATLELGAERSFFASIKGEGRDAHFAFILDCDASWWHRYRFGCGLHSHPWFTYAARHSVPTTGTDLGASAPEHQTIIDNAVAAGFASTALIPVHSGQWERRVGLLCLGHSSVGYFEDPSFTSVVVAARSLALELHARWSDHERVQLSQRTRLSEPEIRLLERHCAGRSSKQIAEELNVSCQSINSRFQRIIAKLGVRNRREAMRLAIDCGLIVM